jgi:hypothetical protein
MNRFFIASEHVSYLSKKKRSASRQSNYIWEKQAEKKKNAGFVVNFITKQISIRV